MKRFLTLLVVFLLGTNLLFAFDFQFLGGASFEDSKEKISELLPNTILMQTDKYIMFHRYIGAFDTTITLKFYHDKLYSVKYDIKSPFDLDDNYNKIVDILEEKYGHFSMQEGEVTSWKLPNEKIEISVWKLQEVPGSGIVEIWYIYTPLDKLSQAEEQKEDELSFEILRNNL